MQIYEIIVGVRRRDLSVKVKEGVLATVETGSLQEGTRVPKDRVTVLVGQTQNGPTAWVQIADYDTGRAARITHEGWIDLGSGQVQSLSTLDASRATLSRLSNPTAEVLRCQEQSAFGTDACCTSHGNGCYVRCCGGCCSDPVGCPGAGCCP